MQHVVMFSGGIASWATGRRLVEIHGSDNLILLFADTRMEDEDLYRFLIEASANVGGRFVQITEGRTPWEVFSDVRYLGNTRIDPCSRILKRELMRKWLDKNCDPAATTVYLGFDWNEFHRFERAKGYWSPWSVESPLLDPPLLLKEELIANLRATGIQPPRLYDMGFAHNNCGGFCIKAGQAQFRLLLEKMPERYAEHEAAEEKLRQELGKDVAILRDRRGGKVKPLTLRALREREDYDRDDWGACACMEEPE